MSVEAALRSIRKTVAVSGDAARRRGWPLRKMAVSDRALLREMALEERSTWRRVRERVLKQSADRALPGRGVPFEFSGAAGTVRFQTYYVKSIVAEKKT